MGSLDKRIRQLEELYRASPGSTDPEDLPERKAALLETTRSARDKAKREALEHADYRRLHALDDLEESMRRRARGA